MSRLVHIPIALALLLAIARAALAAEPARPNVVWFISDDLSPYLGAYGDAVARTPTIDALAATGIRFDAAWADAPVCAPSRFALITGLYSATAGPAHHMRATARMPSSVRAWPELLRRAGYYTLNNFKGDYNADIDVAATWDDASPTAHWRNRPAGAPFFAQFTSLTTHESSVFVHRPGQTDPAHVRIPAVHPDTAATRADAAQYYDRIAQMDGELAQRLAELDADGLADDTIVFYFSDNGGVLPWSKRFANERGLRVPLIVHVPPKWAHLAPATSGAAPVGFVDLPPTVLTMAGVDVPEHMQGAPLFGRKASKRRYAFGQRSRMDERYDLQRAVRDERFVYVRNYMPHRPYGQHVAFMWNQRGYQEWEEQHRAGRLTPLLDRFWNAKPSEELYDVRTDPDQLENLAGARAYRTVLRRMRKALDAHMLAIRDNGFLPEGSPLEGYTESRARRAYPLRRVLRVAWRAIARDPKHRDALAADLDDRNEIVRWWAAQGIVMLGEAGRPAMARLAARLDADPSVHVRVAVAEALARLGDAGRPAALLAETLDGHDDRRVRLLALNAMTDLPIPALTPYRDVVARAASSPDEYVANGGRYLGAVLDGTYDPHTPP